MATILSSPTRHPRSRRDRDMPDTPEPFHVSCMGKEDGPKVYNIYVFDVIEAPEQFIPAIEACQLSREEDTICVHLNTPGGDTNATDAFLHSLSYSPANVVFAATGGVHSAGTVILMSALADNVSYSDGFHALVHNGSMGTGGKFSDFRDAAAFYTKYEEDTSREIYRGFLTDEELVLLYNGKDFWFTADEFDRRLRNRNNLLFEEEQAQKSQET